MERTWMSREPDTAMSSLAPEQRSRESRVAIRSADPMPMTAGERLMK
jgi:hypothetical protein